MNNIFDFLYPTRCPGCRKVMETSDGLIHEKCRTLFKRIMEPCCMKCGRHLGDEEDDICTDCRRKRHSYSYGLALYEYNETARAAMIDYKKNGIRSFGDFFAHEAAERFRDILSRIKPEALVPVPVSRRRYHERGFNQSEYLADKIGERLNIPVDTQLIMRKGNVQQKYLSGIERAANSEHSFFVTGEPGYKRVCLVDDVYTTGSTLDGCSKALLEAGVRETGFLVIFSGEMY